MPKPLSKEFLFSRGRCCYNGCINCPYIGGHEMGLADADINWEEIDVKEEYSNKPLPD
jgi:hypothetical protein